MASIRNFEEVKNQVSGDQNVHGSVFLGTVNNITNNLIQDSDKLANSNDMFTLNDKILSSLAFPEMFERRANVERAHSNTCMWIFDTDEYQQWSSQGGLLWIKGKPGAGKSTLMSFLHQELNKSTAQNPSDHRTSLEYFFHGRGSELQRTPFGMFRALLNQMLTQQPNACSEIRSLFKARHNAFGSGSQGWTWQQNDLESSLTSAVQVSAEHRPIIIFVDALDEAGEKSARAIAKYFHNLNERMSIVPQVKCHICISSRHYPVPSATKGLEVWVEKHNGDDISRYVHNCLSYEDWVDDDDAEITPWCEIRTEVVSRSNGIFQWSRLVAEMLERQFSDGETATNCLKWLQRVPQQLEDVYDHILRRVLAVNNLHLSYHLFQWICLAETPMSLAQTRHALALHDVPIAATTRCEDTSNFVANVERLKARIRALSGGLIEAIRAHDDSYGSRSDEPDSFRVQLIHQSVSDYMHAKGLTLLNSVQYSRTKLGPQFGDHSSVSQIIHQGHAALYRSCLKLFASEMPLMMPLKRVYGTIPIMGYASKYLFVHAQKASKCRGVDLSHEFYLLATAYAKWNDEWRFAINPGELNDSLICYLAYYGLNDLLVWINQFGSTSGMVTADMQRSFHRTALQFACGGGHLSTVQILLSAGVMIDATSRMGTALVAATRFDHLPIVKELLSHGASLSCNETQYCAPFEHVLYSAVYFKRSEIVRFLLDSGVPADSWAGKRKFALAWACGSRQKDVAEMLLDKGANIDALDDTMSTALTEACLVGDQDMVRMLIKKGANVNEIFGVRSPAGATIHKYLPEHEGTIIAKILIDAGADVNINVIGARSWLQQAVVLQNADLVRTLVAAGAVVNPQENEDLPALFQAVAPGTYGDEDLTIMRIMLEAGADVNARNGDLSLLEYARKYGRPQMAQLIVEFGATTEDVRRVKSTENSSNTQPDQDTDTQGATNDSSEGL